MIDTSLWINQSGFWQQSTQVINAYATNVTNGYTMGETINGQQYGSNKLFSTGHSLINHPNQSIGYGKSVRPPQRFSIDLTGGGHAHFVPDISQISVYGNSVNEGGESSTVPTGVIGIGIETYRLAGTQQITDAPTGNDAEMEIDIWIFDASNPTAYMKLENYPISTTGLGSNYNPQYGTASIVWRGALGVTAWDRAYLTHNTQSNAWTYVGGWTLGHLFNETGKIVVAYRIHDVVAPYSITNNVPRAGNGADVLAQQGIYDNTPQGTDHRVDISGSVRVGGSTAVSHGQDVDNYAIGISGRVRTQGTIVTNVSHAHEVEGIRGRINPTGTFILEHTSPRLTIFGQLTFEASRLDTTLTRNGTAVSLDKDGEAVGGGGFIPVIMMRPRV